jgi:hypothetical protein
VEVEVEVEVRFFMADVDVIVIRLTCYRRGLTTELHVTTFHLA